MRKAICVVKLDTMSTKAETTPNWWLAFFVALFATITFAILWNDWFFGGAIGAMLGIVAAYTFPKAKPPPAS